MSGWRCPWSARSWSLPWWSGPCTTFPRSQSSRGSRDLALPIGSLVGGQGSDEGFLRDLDPPDGLHPPLALLLLLQQLALAGDVAAVALGQHVLAQRADVLARDDPGADGSLDRHLELLPRDQLLQPGGHRQAGIPRLIGVPDLAERVDRQTLQQDVDLDQVSLLLPGRLVVQ